MKRIYTAMLGLSQCFAVQALAAPPTCFSSGPMMADGLSPVYVMVLNNSNTTVTADARVFSLPPAPLGPKEVDSVTYSPSGPLAIPPRETVVFQLHRVSTHELQVKLSEATPAEVLLSAVYPTVEQVPSNHRSGVIVNSEWTNVPCTSFE